MNSKAARRIARLYPRKWRDRYGEEFQALLEQLPPSPIVILDVVAHVMALRRGAIATALALIFALCVFLGTLFGHMASQPAMVAARPSAALHAPRNMCLQYSSLYATGMGKSKRCSV